MLSMRSRRLSKRGFSLVELLVVLAIVSVLAAVLLPVFWTARGKAREIVCNSNLRQIGLGVTMYLQDYDARYPYAVDAVDRAASWDWRPYPRFYADLPHLPLVQDVLQPYVNSRAVFDCPSDTGFAQPDFTSVTMDAFPTSFEKFGSSYFYHTKLAALQLSEAGLDKPSECHLLFDVAGHWHGTLTPLAQRYNVLFADGHVKNISRGEFNGYRAEPLTSALAATPTSSP